MKKPTVTHGREIAFLSFFLSFLILVPPIQASESVEAYLDIPLEDLLSMEVTSVSKKKQRLHEVAAAVFVITQEDIQRSGVTSIPEALRMAPGIQVSRIDANKWAISSRGFSNQFTNKLLVLIDGRTVYTPSYSGVYWDAQDTLLEDIDRIEVIRGPGATVWGARFSQSTSIDDSCQVVFVSRSKQAFLESIFKILRQRPILTIGDTKRFAERGGMIQFTSKRKRIGFKINLKSAKRTGLKIAASLLELATVMK